VVERRGIGSWLDGPGAASGVDHGPPGKRLGLPEQGPGSVGRSGRRVLALLVDWVAALLIANLLARGPVQDVASGAGSLIPLAVLFVENALLVGTVGATLGHRLLGLRVASLTGGPVGLRRGAVRAALLVLAVPALVWDRDQRGLHDKAAGTVLLKT
jgi:uncharacterized RDD family membrane protein YckC